VHGVGRRTACKLECRMTWLHLNRGEADAVLRERLDSPLVLPLPLIGDLPQQVVFRPGEIGRKRCSEAAF
jgi:hypothetical protein